MRPVRAFAMLSVTLAMWAVWRFDEASVTYAAMLSARRGAAATQARSAEPVPAVHALVPLAISDAPALAGRLVAMHSAPEHGAKTMIAGAAASPDAHRPDTASGAPPVSASRLDSMDTAFGSAEAAYRALAGGDRRAAAQGFTSALAADPRHPNAAAWRAELSALRKRWRMDAYSLVREGASGLVSDRPLLGGGQSGIRLSYAPDPLARHPVELFGRAAIAHDGLSPKGRSAQAAIGAAWMPLGRGGPAVGVERLIALGREGRDAWAIRVSGGAWHAADAQLPLDLSAYAEAGIVGANRRDGFAGAQAFALYPVATRKGTRIGIGGGVWGSVQDGETRTASRLELGPGAQLSQQIRKGTIELRGEYRFRIAGDAAPGSGPTLTVATRF
ncbi:hypothetical protein [Sphingosinicella sp.]|jgi:hypothetical protein|uniref:hypothetical protein n=1 Tax=Sphingosinicella sp. TaxID=1917971 RepID=UPI0035B35D14